VKKRQKLSRENRERLTAAPAANSIKGRVTLKGGGGELWGERKKNQSIEKAGKGTLRGKMRRLIVSCDQGRKRKNEKKKRH